MFELLFKYPLSLFAKGQLVLLASWPAWALFLAVGAVAAMLGLALGRRGGSWGKLRALTIWLLESALAAVVLIMLWQPALSVATLKPQQNIVALVLDDSRSMALVEDGQTRSAQVIKTLRGGLLDNLQKKFQVRLYRMGGDVQRMEKIESLTAAQSATRIGATLKQVVAEAGSLPIGAVVLLSDGGDNSGGIDLQTISEIRRHRIPVHTIGYGREKFAHDVEISDVITPARALADSRLSAVVTLHQQGYENQKGRITLRDGQKTLATQEVKFKTNGTMQTETLLFNAGAAGARNLTITVDPLQGEENVKNNSVMRLVHVTDNKPRVLYIEGEPRWEFKFIRRAIELDKSLDLVTMLRTTQNKIYRQGISNTKELEDGFPVKVEDLFAYSGLIIGSVEASYFSTAQQELIRQFVDRRGGGVLFLGGRDSLADGGYANTPMAEMMPVVLPTRKGTFLREPANPELTGAGRDSLITRIDDNPDRNVERWKKLPFLMNFQEPGTPKPGAVVLAEMTAQGKKMPLLITQNYGRGRSAVFASAGSWRWQMQMPKEDMSHEMFWQQMLRWLVAGAPGHVVAGTPKQLLTDETQTPLRAEVRDRNYLPASDAVVEAHIMGPEGISATVPLEPDPLTPGVYTATYSAEKPGAYLGEVTVKRNGVEEGKDVVMFRREDGVAENFHAEQNRELLEKLSSETGGRYYKPADVSKLSEEISYSEAGITTRETRDLWNMPFIFLLLAALRAAEWLLRRKWGAV